MTTHGPPRTTWLVTSLSPGTREKMSKHSEPAGDIGGLLVRLRSLQERVRARRKQLPPLVVIQEAGLEGFWIHRVLTEDGIESHVVDPASVATSRRRRRAKTDKLDGDTLVRTLLAYKRDEFRHAIVAADTATSMPRMLIELKGIGNEFASVLWTECLYRRFDNRRQVSPFAHRPNAGSRSAT